MNELNTVLETLRAHSAALKSRGVVHASVFGSTARGERNARSDVDIVIDLDALRPLNVFDYAAIKDEIRTIVGGKVDVVVREGLKKPVRERVESEAVDAF